MTSPNGFFQKVIHLESRSFSLRVQKFENGYFISVTEGPDKLGSMAVSLMSGPVPVTTNVTPSRTESLFLKLVAERVSTKVGGIALVSTFVQKQLEPAIAKGLMLEIMNVIDNE